MSQPVTLTLKHEGRPIRLSLTQCSVSMAGEFAGNVDLHVDCDPSLEGVIHECLRLESPGESAGLESIASGGPDDGVMLIFSSEAIMNLEDVPQSLAFLWCGERIAELSPELTESVPIESVHQLIDPLEFLDKPPVQTSNPFCIGFERDWILLFPAFVLSGLGATILSVPIGFRDGIIPYVQIAACALVVFGSAIAAAIYWRPRRQVWFDRLRRELLLVETRARCVEKSLENASRVSADDYAHVRICERAYAAGPNADSDSDGPRTEYLVRLEGHIGFAASDGRVHSRTDALHLATFNGERAANRFAAEVGYHAGLRILIATDW